MAVSALYEVDLSVLPVFMLAAFSFIISHSIFLVLRVKRESLRKSHQQPAPRSAPANKPRIEPKPPALAKAKVYVFHSVVYQPFLLSFFSFNGPLILKNYIIRFFSCRLCMHTNPRIPTNWAWTPAMSLRLFPKVRFLPYYSVSN